MVPAPSDAPPYPLHPVRLPNGSTVRGYFLDNGLLEIGPAGLIVDLDQTLTISGRRARGFAFTNQFRDAFEKGVEEGRRL